MRLFQHIVRAILVPVLLVACVAAVAAQGNPTGTIRGTVSDPDGLALPGVTVTVTSPALQGPRTAVTSEHGDFILPFLPPGTYEVVCELSGFGPFREKVEVAMAAVVPIEAKLTIAKVEETVTVVGTTTAEALKNVTIAATYKKENLELLPVDRTLTGATLLAPGVNPNGPGGNIVMSGALSFENLFLVNGVTVNENLRGQPLLLYIEDAVQETKVSTGSISAEYGRFQGGVVNMITKSGGNNFSGSFRTSIANDAWRAMTPYAGDQTVNAIEPTYEMTAGGPILRDKLWFFGAGRFTSPERNRTLDYTGDNYTLGTDDKRGEGKITYALNSSNNIKGSYTKRALKTTNNSFGTIMDKASLYNNGTDYTLKVLNYTSVLTNTLFFEGQWSEKIMATKDTGSQFSDLVKGTPIWDRSRGQARFNSPTFCAVCGSGWLEHRDNWDYFFKLSYFLSTANAGSHNLVGGFDNYKEKRQNNNYQSGSGYRIQSTTSIIDGVNIYPVFNSNNSTYIEYLPLVAESVGNDIKTYSGFVNDAWRVSGKMSLNLGVRYDHNSSKDQTGLPVVKDSKWSPRLGMNYDLKGDGTWVMNAGFARYVMSISTALVDAGSAGGRTATYSWFYQGPAINTGSGPYLTAEQALPQLFNWFNANGGQTRATRNAPSIPGVTTQVAGGTVAPNSDEYTIGLGRQLGKGRGSARIDYMYRKYHDIYGDFLDMSTGTVTDPTGRKFNLTMTKNTPDAKRTFKGAIASVGYRVGPANFGGNYTLSWSHGNVDGEDSGSGPIRASINTYPEYRQQAWNTPMGYTMNDQRQKFRGWLSYRLPVSAAVGNLDLGVMQRFDSALPYDDSAVIDSRPYVTNPGYITPPSTVTYYFSERYGLRWDNTWTTDLSLNWGKKLSQLGTTELFFRGIVTNIFNNMALQTGNSVVNTAASPGSAKGLVAFNPFTSTPVEGVNWVKSPDYGTATGVSDYQTARTFSFSVGVKF